MKLKPCPFCGGEKIETVEFEVAGSDLTYVVCVNCGSCGKLHHQKQAIEAWNRREPIDKIIAKLESSFMAEENRFRMGVYLDVIEMLEGDKE